MPRLYKILGYSVYFWTNEGVPLEPIHVHVSKGAASANSTKIWITQAGGVLVQNNDSKIPTKHLHYICDVIAAQSKEIEAKWKEYFGELKFYL